MKLMYEYKPKRELKDKKMFLIWSIKNDKFIIGLFISIILLLPAYYIALNFKSEFLIIVDPLIYGVGVCFISYFILRALNNFIIYIKLKKESLKFKDFVYDIFFYDNYLSINIKNLPDHIIYFKDIKKIIYLKDTIYLILKNKTLSESMFSFNKMALINVKTKEFTDLLKVKVNSN